MVTEPMSDLTGLQSMKPVVTGNKRRGSGVPQAGPLSPMLANIMLDDFDWQLEKRGLRFLRYADDFSFSAKTAPPEIA